MSSGYHRSVLLQESISALNIRRDGVYVDATFGGGGHTRAILELLGDEGRVVAFDQDTDAWRNAPEDTRLLRVAANFEFLKQYVRFHGVGKVDGVLADLGVSSHQFDTGARGFSTRFPGPLDMRMNQESELTAARVVNEYEEEALQRLFSDYGELPRSRAMARAIAERRSIAPIRTTEELLDAVLRLMPKGKENKLSAQLFQALRIEVNREMDALKALLEQSAQILKENGRLVVISYHSLEDRMVKRFIRDGRFDGKEAEKDLYGRTSLPFRRKGGAVKPTAAEVVENPRARSAILRVAERTAEEG